MIYKNSKRDNRGSQKEVPNLEIKENKIIVSGYHKYEIIENKINLKGKKQKFKIISDLLKEYYLEKECNSLTDIGCSNGLFSLQSIFFGYNVFALDHDDECINLINLIKTELKLENLESLKYSFGDDINKKSDIVIMLALIHWIYSCTTIYGNFDDIFTYINKYVNKYLFIEWIDPTDSVIKKFKHLDFNKKSHKVEYNVKNFEKSLLKNIGNITYKKVLDKETRILYVVKKK